MRLAQTKKILGVPNTLKKKKKDGQCIIFVQLFLIK